MKSMTDFIDSINVIETPSIYNEDYSWAEGYSEYFNDASDNYIQPILESSSYQFFGEAAFYQEAHKGLIAGGILALVSGAFFMIMKLLKGDSSGGSNTKSSSNKSSSKSEPEKSVDRTLQHVNDVQSIVSKKAEDAKKNLNATFDGLEKAGADVGDARNLLNKGSSNSQKSQEKPKHVEPKKTSEILPELEAEEKIVFNVKTIIDALKKFKKENGNAGTPYDMYQLKLIKEGLDEVDTIVLLMVGITRDDLWYVVSSSDIKDKAVLRFLENKHRLDEIISKLKSDSKDLGNKIVDAKPDDIIERLTEIDNLIRSIEKNCKAGMKVCKEKRQLENYKKDVPNIDKVYKRLNDVLKDINIVCKNIQNEFKTIRKSLHGKSYQTINLYINDNAFEFEYGSDDKEFYIRRFKRAFSALSEATNTHKMYSVFAHTMIERDRIRYALDSSQISDSEIDKWNNDVKQRYEKRIKNSRKAESIMFNDLKKNLPDYEKLFENLENLATRQLDLVEALVNTPIKDTLNKSIDEIPAAMKLKEFNDTFENSIVDIIDKMWDNGVVVSD